MRRAHARNLLLAGVACVALLAPTVSTAAPGDRNDRQRGRNTQGVARQAYAAGYQAGLREGLQRGRRAIGDRNWSNARRPDIRIDARYRNGRDRDDFRRGFGEGYDAGFARVRAAWGRPGFQVGIVVGNGPRAAGRRAIGEPAFARGFADGYERGLDDGDDGDRYDPVRHRDYRQANDGYFREYGPQDAYRANYRAGFSEGYESGYRDGRRRW
ncbi:MAG: hypothetical protein AB7G23_08200 [Vicinamibacterales bacterium]